MTITEPMRTATLEPTDVALVSESLAGNRSSFERIVTRYQTLICSLAYSATGSIPQSEDLAQETFVTAWKQLSRLNDHDKLRAWLCGIARFTISNALRKQGREPSHDAESLDAVAETSAADALPADRVISREEQAILWRAIEQIPETYREPLVLFYREHQSVEAVAEALDLSEDAVKQRLSRGRKMLHEEVVALVEGGLARTNPGRVFTASVIAVLPSLILPAQAAASVGTLAAKGAAKAAFGNGAIGLVLAPIVALFGTWVSYRMDVDSAGSEVERQLSKTFYRRLAWGLGSWFVVSTLLILFSEPLRKSNEHLLAVAFIVISLAYAGFIGSLMLWWTRARRAYLDDWQHQQPVVKPAWEYRSPHTFCGLPLVHIRIGGDLRANRTPVRGWIAMGDTAIGGLFAFGGISIAPISVGGCAIGLFSFGGAAVGALVLGGSCLGIWAFGGLAFGWQAFGGCAIAWNAAVGGAAIAHDFALGGIAFALQAGNAAAKAFIETQSFFRYASYILQHYMIWLNLVWVTPMLVWWQLVRRAKANSQVA
jgi:RNA polymerase sigma factor (sigma-70 family)